MDNIHKEFIEKYKQFVIKSCLLDKNTIINDNDIIINDKIPDDDTLELPVRYTKTNKIYSFNIDILPDYNLSDCIKVAQRLSKYHEVNSTEDLDNINNN